MALPPYPGLDMTASGNGHAPSRAAPSSRPERGAAAPRSPGGLARRPGGLSSTSGEDEAGVSK
jgi:hypothetical protein